MKVTVKVLILVCLLSLTQSLLGQNERIQMNGEKREKREKQERKSAGEDQEIEKTVYMFGISNQLADSVYYVTDIHEIKDAKMLKRQRFLRYRDSYGIQLKRYLEGDLGNMDQTVTIVFDTNLKRLEKTKQKIKKITLKDPAAHIVTITSEEFKFEKVG